MGLGEVNRNNDVMCASYNRCRVCEKGLEVMSGDRHEDRFLQRKWLLLGEDQQARAVRDHLRSLSQIPRST